jgi:RNA polymerase sigma factor (sigma-70 family)
MDNSTTHRLLRQIRQLIRTPAHNQASDRQLLERFAEQHDETAFRILVDRHGPLVLGVGRRLLGDAHEAEDVFQATFLVLARKAGARRWRASVGPWLYQVAYRLALKTRTDLGRQRAVERQVRPGQVAEAEAEVSRRELARVLDDEVQRLPVRYRLPIVLCYLEGRGNAEAAAQLGWRVSTLKGRLARARVMLRGRLSRRGLALTAGAILLPEETASAAVSPSLADSTARIATLLAANDAIGVGGASVVVTRLAEGMLHAMWVSKVKAALALTLVLVLASGAGLLTHQVLAGKQQTETPAEAPEPLAGGPGEPLTPSEKPLRTDRFGDPLPEGALARLGTIRFRHGNRIFSAVFSPDGRTLATGGAGRGACLWDVATGKELHCFAQGTVALSVALSPDGKYLAAACGHGEISLWEVSTGKKVFQQKAHRRCDTVQFSPDGKTLATGGQQPPICLWSVPAGQKIHQIEGHKNIVHSMMFSPDGTALATGSYFDDELLRLWDPATGKALGVLAGYAFAFSPDSRKIVSVAPDKEAIRFWDVATQKQVAGLKGSSQGAGSVAFSPDGKVLATGNEGGTISLWDLTASKELRRWQAHGSPITTVAFSPDGRILVSGAYEGSCPRLWDVATGTEISPTTGSPGPVHWLTYTPDGRGLLSASPEKVLLRWDLATGREDRWLDWSTDGHWGFMPAPNGRRVATWGWPDHPVQLCEAATGKGHPLPLTVPTWESGHQWTPLAFSPDGKLLAGAGSGGAIHLLDVASGREQRHFGKYRETIQALTFSTDGKFLAVAAADHDEHATIGLWEVATGKDRHTLDAPGFVNFLSFSPDGQLLGTSGGPYGPVRLWDVSRGKELYKLGEDRGEASGGLAFSPDGRLLAVASPLRPTIIWETWTGRQVRQLRGQMCGAASVCFSPDGRSLASGGWDSTVVIWDLTGRMKNGRLAALRLSQQELAARWNDLGNADAARAFQAGWDLVAAVRQTVPYLRERLQPVQPAAPQRLAQLIADLDSPNFAQRERASGDLEKLGALAEKPLRQALASQPSVELRRRIDDLLGKLSGPVTQANELRALRAVWVLEQIGTPAAREVLQALATGAPDARPTQEAKASLARLAH